jgi:uncharacterized membrane protein
MWLSRPVYEFLPYAYMLAGALLLGGASYAGAAWHTPLLMLGVVLLVFGAVLWLKRRDYRRSQSEYNSKSLDD